MRKIICIGLLLVMAFSLTACIVPDPADADADKVTAAKDALTIATETSADLVLPGELEGYDGVNITWASSNEAVISNAGVVVRQDEDIEVTLTATLTYGNAQDTKAFSVTVAKVITGTFHSLQAAYDAGWLTVEDLKSIAYYRGGRNANPDIMAEDYAPIPKNPEVLSEEVEMAIKEQRAAGLRTQTNEYGKLTRPDATTEDITIKAYYGTYGSCVVLVMGLAFVTDFWEQIQPIVSTLGGVTFVDMLWITIWKQS